MCTRTPFDALEVTHPAGTSRISSASLRVPRDGHPTDWVLLATKAHQSEAAGPWLAALCGPETKLAVLQNGVVVMLPEADAGLAWRRLAALVRERKLLERDIVAIDLRLPDRTTLRLTDDAVRERLNRGEEA